MANERLLSNPIPQFLFADHATDFGAAPATAANSLIIGTPTDVQIDCTSLAASGGYRQSAKFDFGATRAPLYRVDACIELAIAPTDGDLIDFYLGGSPNTTAGTGNPADLTGADAAYTETDGLLAQLTYAGSLSCDAATIVIGHVGFVVPTQRYGILVIGDQADQAFATTMDELHITFTPVTDGT